MPRKRRAAGRRGRGVARPAKSPRLEPVDSAESASVSQGGDAVGHQGASTASEPLIQVPTTNSSSLQDYCVAQSSEIGPASATGLTPASISVLDDHTAEMEKLKKRVEELEAEKNSISDTLNDKKAHLASTEIELRNTKTLNIALTDSVQKMQTDLSMAKAEVQSLKFIKEDLFKEDKSKQGTNKSQKAHGKVEQKRTLLNEVGTEFFGIASTVKEKILQTCRNETSEMMLLGSGMERNWKRRSGNASRFGIRDSSGQLLSPLNPVSISQCRDVFTPAYASPTDILSVIVDHEMKSPSWASVFEESPDTKMNCINVVSESSVLKAKVRQCLSDVMSQRKRDARNALFGGLGYEYLRSRTSCITDESKKLRDDELKTVKARILVKVDEANPESDIRMNTWRTVPDELLKKNSNGIREGARDYPQEQEESPNALELLNNNVSKSVMGMFSGFDLAQSETFPTIPEEGDDQNYRGTKKEASIMLFARLDAWIVTVIDVLTPMSSIAQTTQQATEQNTENPLMVSPAKKSYGPGYVTQKLYADSFAKNLVKATDQLIGEIRAFMMLWIPHEIFPECNEMGNEAERENSLEKFYETERSSTSLFDISSEGTVYVSASRNFFSKYICSYINVQDCYIASIDIDTKKWVPLGTGPKKFYSEKTTADINTDHYSDSVEDLVESQHGQMEEDV